MRRRAVWLSAVSAFLAAFFACLAWIGWNAAWLDGIVGMPRALGAPTGCAPAEYLSVTREGALVVLRGRLAGDPARRQVLEALGGGSTGQDAIVDAVAVGGVADDGGLAGRAVALASLFHESGQHMWLGRDVAFFLGSVEDEVARESVTARFGAVNRPREVAVSLVVDPALMVRRIQGAIDERMRGTVIEFEVASTIIRRESLPVLDAIAATLLQAPQVRLRIAGHTDAQGDRGSNRALSLARANAVRSYLASRTVSPARLVAVGYGAERPLGPNRTPEGRRLNRRIEFTVEREAAR